MLTTEYLLSSVDVGCNIFIVTSILSDFRYTSKDFVVTLESVENI